MKNKTIKLFSYIFENSVEYLYEIRSKIYNSIGIITESDSLMDYIKESVDDFNFNLVETQFLNDIENIMNESLDKIEFSQKNNEYINYEDIKNSIIEQLSSLKNINITMSDDLNALAVKIVHKFPETGLSKDDLILHFARKQNELCELIRESNKELLETLIYHVPYYVEELEENIKCQNIKPLQEKTKEGTDLEKETKNRGHEEISLHSPQKKSGVDVKEIISNIDVKMNNIRINELIYNCKKKYNELQRRMSYLNSGSIGIFRKNIRVEISIIPATLKKLEKLLEKLSNGEISQELINKISTDSDISTLSEKIINEEIPEVKRVSDLIIESEQLYRKDAKVPYEQYELPVVDFDAIHNRIISTTSLRDLLEGKKFFETVLNKLDYDTNLRLKEEYKLLINKIITLSTENTKKKEPSPEPTPNLNASVGNSKSDIEYLIKSNQYFGVLHAIPRAESEKYRSFISLGFDIMINKVSKQMSECKTLDDKEQLYEQLYEIREGFKDYAPTNSINELNIILEDMKKEIMNEQSKKQELDGVRYNTSRPDGKNSSIAKK